MRSDPEGDQQAAGAAEQGEGALPPEAMSITEAEKKIKAFADAHKTGGFACVTPEESDRILREFYGLPPRPGGAGDGLGLDLADFWG